MFKCTRHGILAADRRKAEADLGSISAEKGRKRLTPAGRILCHPPEILLECEADLRYVTARRCDLGNRCCDSPGGTVIRAPLHKIRIIAIAHEGDSLSLSVKDRNFGRHCLCLGQLIFTAVRHIYACCTDGSIKHFHQALL